MTRTWVVLNDTMIGEHPAEHFYKNGVKRACDDTFLHEMLRSGLRTATLAQVRAWLLGRGFLYEGGLTDYVVQGIDDYLEIHFDRGAFARVERRIVVALDEERIEDVPLELITRMDEAAS